MENNNFKIDFENGKPKIDKAICLNIVCADREPETKDERYNFHLALDFFKNNFLEFNEPEVSSICSNPYALKRLGGHFDITALQICVKNNQAFPVALPSWKDKKIKRELLKKYLYIINEKNDSEQLKFFLEHFHDGVMEFIDENKNISTTLYEGIAKHLFDFTESKINLTAIKNILVKRDVQIIEYLEEYYTHEFKNLLSMPIASEYDNKVTLNVAQYLLLNKEFESLNIINKTFSLHHDLLLEPINNKICLYNQKISLFDYGLANSKLIVFSPFSLDENLSDKEKEQLVAAAFSICQYKHDGFSNGTFASQHISHFEDILKYWYTSIIQNSTNEQLYYYAKEAKIGNEDNSELKKEIDTIVLHKELNSDLNTNSSLTKKMKI